eukprot:UN07366
MYLYLGMMVSQLQTYVMVYYLYKFDLVGAAVCPWMTFILFGQLP